MCWPRRSPFSLLFGLFARPGAAGASLWMNKRAMVALQGLLSLAVLWAILQLLNTQEGGVHIQWGGGGVTVVDFSQWINILRRL